MKNFRFKSIAAAVLVATTLSGCLKNGLEMLSKSNEIVFSTPNTLLAETRAVTETSAAEIASNGFKVLAKVNSDQSVLFNKMVQKDNGVWKVPGETYYFPTGTTMDFYAIYPGSGEIMLTDADKKATFDYTVTTNDDLVAASTTGVTSAASAVPLEFSHILSQIAFTFKGSDTEVNYALNSLVIKAPESGSYDFVSKNWGNLAAEKDFYVITAASTLPVSATATAAGESMTFIPGNLTAEISWSCLQNGREVAAYQTSLPLSVTQGAKNIINFSLPNCGGDAVAFTTTTVPWEESQTQIVIEKLSYASESVFTVNDSGKRVKFTKGNLYWDGGDFRFEEHQYDFPTERDPNHVGHFFYSKTASIAYAASYSDASKTPSDKFFAANGGAIEGYTVLDKDEWQYLIDNALAKNSSSENTITIDGKSCVVLKPDGFNGTVADDYTADEWAEAEKSGLVALPFAGYYISSSIGYAGSRGICWSSTPYPGGGDDAWGVCFDSGSAVTSECTRNLGCTVRLVSVVPDSPVDEISPKPVKFQAKSEQSVTFDIDWWTCDSDLCNQDIHLEYSYDNSEWSQWEDLYEPLVFGTAQHPYVLLRGINPDGFGYYCPDCYEGEGPVFMFNDYAVPVYCSGDLMSLIDYTGKVDEIPCEGCFGGLFIMQPIATAPVLSAKTLKKGCYDRMFNGCWNLNYIECLAENFPDDITCDAWTYGVANSGTFIKAPGIKDNWIPQGWTVMNSDGTADDLPLSTENGVFTIYPSGKKVKFAPGNLFWDGSDFRFEEHQYDFPTEWDPNHVGHFYWSKDAEVACAEDYYDPDTAEGDTFFADNGGAITGWTMLTREEWSYILSTRHKLSSNGSTGFKIASKNLTNCTIIVPDNFDGVLQDSYTAEEWEAAETEYGLVALPFSGDRGGSTIYGIGGSGGCWLSSPCGSDYAFWMNYNMGNANTYRDYREYGGAARLVKAAE